jgi:hypothetical protein
MTPIEESGAGEELEPHGTRRLRLDLLVAGAVLVGVVLAGRALTGDQRHAGPGASPSAGRSSGPLADPSFAVPSSVVITRADGQRRLVPRLPPRTGDPALCPTSVACSPQTASPAVVQEPIAARFPQADLLDAATVRLREAPWAGSLWFRRLIFRVNGGELSIRIVARGPDARADSGRIGDLLFVRTTLEQYEVITQAPAAAGVTLEDLRRIAADDRLLAT